MNAFQKGVPSVFVISSPFQAICLVSAILNLEIKDYQVIVISSDRNTQVFSVLNRFKIPYVVRYSGWHRWRIRLFIVTSIIHRHNKYNRLFLGDFRSIDLIYFGLNYISDGADIVYLDDGNATIALFQGVAYSKPYSKIDEKCQSTISRRRRFVFLKYYYSIYANLSNANYIIEYNSLSILCVHKDDPLIDNVVFIGANTKRYCETMNIPEESFNNALDTMLQRIRKTYPKTKITYVPHGADKSGAVMDICSKYEVDYHRIIVPIELYYMDKECPIAIYGFGSSAIYNLKQMFPETVAFSILLEPSNKLNSFERKKIIAQYYSECGIEQLTIKV